MPRTGTEAGICRPATLKSPVKQVLFYNGNYGMIRNTPFYRQTRTADLIGLLVMVFVTGGLFYAGVGLLFAFPAGFIAGIAAMVLTFRDYSEDA
jgi:hypothetical protein